LSAVLHTVLLVCAAAVFVRNSTFQSNKADVGGAIAVFGGPSLEIHDCEFDSNTAINPTTGDKGAGGAVFLHQQAFACLNISTSRFRNNTAGVGGAIFFSNNVLHMSDVQLLGNNATSSGGALNALGNGGRRSICCICQLSGWACCWHQQKDVALPDSLVVSN
jgi:hypothetical protein